MLLFFNIYSFSYFGEGQNNAYYFNRLPPSTLGLYLGYKVINVHHLITILFIYINGIFDIISCLWSNLICYYSQFQEVLFNNAIVIMGRKNLNPRSANQLRYKALGRSFTNIVAKNSLICLLWFIEVIEFSDKSYTI